MALRGLLVEETRTGLWGRLIMTLSKVSNAGDEELPTHRFSAGDIVCIKTKNGAKTTTGASGDEEVARGVIYKVTSTKIQVALSSKPVAVLNAQPVTRQKQEAVENESMNMDYNGRIVTLMQMGNDTTFKRMEHGLKQLAELQASNGLSTALKVLFGIETAEKVDIARLLPLKQRYTNAIMNESQLNAVSGAMAASSLFLIHGPPGTGKTTVLTEYILQAVKEQGLKLLVCAPSNVAVDNIVERLSPFSRNNFKMVRIGHPARVQQSIALNYTVEELYRQSNGYEVVKALEEDMDKLAKEIQRGSTTFAARRQLKRDWIDLKRDLKKVSTTAMKQVILDANVVLATCTGADDRLLRGEGIHFDVVVVDEAAQALDPIIMVPLLKSKKIVLAGDHLQLPPTIKSSRAVDLTLCTTTFFERTIRRAPGVSQLLSVQYRMNDLIMKYSSTALYRGKLHSDESVKQHQLVDLMAKRGKPLIPSSSSNSSPLDEEYLKHPLVLVDTAGCSFEESGGENESKFNEGEAKVVIALVQRLVSAGLSPGDIGIISPYNAQVDLLRNQLRPLVGRDIEIASVDSFQGREKECIIYTMVRSNPKHKVGFLSSDQRTNVAITRARRSLFIVTDSETTSSHKFLKKLLDFCIKNGELWSGAEFVQTYEAIPEASYDSKKKNKKKDKAVAKSSSSPKPSSSSSSAPADASTSSLSIVSDSTTSVLSPVSAPVQASTAPSDTTAGKEDDSFDSSSLVSNAFSGLEIDSSEPTIASEPQITPAEHPSEGNTHEENAIEVLPANNSLPSPSEHAKPATKQSLVTKPPQDYREMQRAKFEAQKKQDSFKAVLPGASSPYAATPEYASSSMESQFGLSSTYYAQPTTRPPKKSAASSSSSPSQKAESSSGKNAPVPVKASLLKLNDDEFLDALVKESETCYFKGCKKSTKILSETCKFCKHIYCLEHFGAEKHGCGADAKREGIAAAKQKAADLRLKATAKPIIDSSAPKMKDWQKQVVNDKLQQKLAAQKEARGKKKTGNNK